MLLERIDIDTHGSLQSVELGPFTEHLNVVLSPQGSGKTAISRFICDSLTNRDYPLGMMSSSSGRVVWADREGLLHCRREQDGTPHGRKTHEFEPRGVNTHFSDSLSQFWLGNDRSLHRNGHALSRSSALAELPESIIDGVITDTTLTDVARVVAACIQSGLDSPEIYRTLPLENESDSTEHRQLRRELAEVESELASTRQGLPAYSTLVARRDELTRRLAEHPRSDGGSTGSTVASAAYSRQLADLHDRASQLRTQQQLLRRWIADLDYQIGASSSGSAAIDRFPAESNPSSIKYHAHSVRHDENLRRELDDLDAQMIRWRRALLEVRGLREAIRSTRQRMFDIKDLDQSAAYDGPIDLNYLRRRRLDGFLHAIDRYDSSRGWRHFYSDDDLSVPLDHPQGSQAARESANYSGLDTLSDLEQRVESATRQIDWLLQRYAAPNEPSNGWYRSLPELGHFTGASLEETLRMIRDDLRHASGYVTKRQPVTIATETAKELRELDRSEQWLVAAIEHLVRYRDSLLHQFSPAERNHAHDWAQYQQQQRQQCHRERAERVAELEQTMLELDACLNEAGRVRQMMRQQNTVDTPRLDAATHASLAREVRAIDDRLARLSRVSWLQSRATQIRERLRMSQTARRYGSPLAESASGWLVRLTGGRLQRIEWPYSQYRIERVAASNNDAKAVDQLGGITLNGRAVTDCSVVDRALAAMAVRMAAGELMAQLGRTIPLVIETPNEILSEATRGCDPMRPQASYASYANDGRHNSPFAAALHDYAHGGRQVLLLSSNQALVEQISRAGGRVFSLQANRIVHPHRPLYRPHFANEHYVGPHPHTYGNEVVGEHPSPLVGSEFDSTHSRPYDINRDFDLAWREAYGMYDADTLGPRQQHPVGPRQSPASERASASRTCQPANRPQNASFQDGYYYADAYTTTSSLQRDHYPAARSPEDIAQPNWAGNVVPDKTNRAGLSHRMTTAEPAFFLTVDSPIDQAPSVDSVAAARLRGLRVTHITHLFQQDPNRLADALGLADVDAATIRRWQSECRLVCRVPKLRGFDARVLVGCGVTDPAQLASTHPTDLLQRVEDFLATEQGQRVLLSGSSRELSRITSWIAAANSFAGQVRGRSVEGRSVNGRSVDGRTVRGTIHVNPLNTAVPYDDRLDAENEIKRYGIRAKTGEQTFRANRDQIRPGTSNASYPTSESRASSGSGNGSGRGRGVGVGRARRRGASRNTRTSGRESRDVMRMQRVDSERANDERGETQRKQRGERRDGESVRRQRSDRDLRESQDGERELRFYLQRADPVVDAPSIGPRMAARLERIGIVTVDDLLNANPESIAKRLNNRRIDADTVIAWQQQATLVCRVPMLRGHDAQLLVAAEITTPERLAVQDADNLFAIIDPISRSREGKRIIRGGKLPDLEEITDWIACAQQHRDLLAA